MSSDDQIREDLRVMVLAAFGLKAWEVGQARPPLWTKVRMTVWLVWPPYRRRVRRARQMRALSRAPRPRRS